MKAEGDLSCAGKIGDIMYGASLIPNLKVLYLANQTFNGMLPTNNFAMPVLEELDLSNNHIKASLSFSAYCSTRHINLYYCTRYALPCTL